MKTKFTNTMHPKVLELAKATRGVVLTHWTSLQEEKNWKRTQTMRALLGGLHRHVGMLVTLRETDADIESLVGDLTNSIRIVYETCERYERTWDDSQDLLEAWQGCSNWIARQKQIDSVDAQVTTLKDLFAI